MNSLEPLRRFQIDSNYKDKLLMLKEQFEYSSRDINIDSSRIKGFGLPLNIPFHLAKNFKQFQQIIFKSHDAVSTELQFMHFWFESRQIFQFENNLASALTNTSIDDIPWSEIHLPYDDFYISFYNEHCIQFTVQPYGFTYLIDGAYIKRAKAGESLLFNENSIIIDFSSKLIEPDYTKAINDNPPGILFEEPIYSFILSGKPNETVKNAIERGEDNYLKYCDYMDNTNYEQSLSLIKKLNYNFNDFIKLSLMKDKYFRGKQYIIPSLPILFNCLFYLTQYPENIHNQYSDHHAKIAYKELDRINNITLEKKINKDILQKEFTRIKFVKDQKISLIVKTTLNSKILRTHWRRGHWRNQFIGGKEPKHKYIWIQPTIVNKDVGTNSTGHIYEV